jgi:hypothetical protein
MKSINTAIKALWESALSCSVCLQSKPNKRWDAVYSFASEKEARQFLQAVTDCCRIVREAKEKEEEVIKGNEPSVGPFSHDSGGGKRNIRGTNSFS